ncbi:DUF1800 domain-containing protein [Pedobacter psychroterrae]|uniref:DUF1800 domain-containing protein n=1 Tax=Pedobacter psychroterrae TaxID=2530453 RepID=A0A4R0NWN8_9SPHI|nr:DUF1800 domain-containing protein [Pedobacter psychroterrae]TCD03474.1 DUF1800 domain-containing protein [Pedobacter psychroterrae]
MNTSLKIIRSFVILFCATLLFSSFQKESLASLIFPFKQAGLTEREAAAHLLSRFTYGARPGEVDKVLKIGLEKWFIGQLEGKYSDNELDKLLSEYPDINLTNTEVENKYPRQAKIVRMAIKDGAVNKDSVNKGDQRLYRQQLRNYMAEKGLKSQTELTRQFINQKILRAAYTENQMRELLTDFWFNHFNVSLTKGQCASFVPAFERDVIRPNVTGKFENLVLGTAKSPAMLIYLDNFNSTGSPVASAEDTGMMMDAKRPKVKKALQNKKGGLNENYAREVMELHTLGVDGGYTQSDVTQAARVLTGWTLAPMAEDGYGSGMKKILDQVSPENLAKRGFVQEGDFLFVPTRHDNGEKTVLGKKFAANRGYEEGVALLTMLAKHPSAAKFISRKIAVRFVNDQPSPKLVERMEKTFSTTGGNIKEVMISMVTAPEFWQKEALREKTKSPFELAISAVRGLDADISQPYQLYTWINKMGQKMYFYQAPTGFPDRGQYWINTGSLLNRMNFGLALAAEKIPGIKINLIALNNNHEPESAEAALTTYSKLVMPERDLTKTVARLKPMLNDPSLTEKIANAAEKTPAPQPKQTEMSSQEEVMMGGTTMEDMRNPLGKVKKMPGKNKKGKMEKQSVQAVAGNNTMLAQVVGVIIGSPEFQRK